MNNDSVESMIEKLKLKLKEKLKPYNEKYPFVFVKCFDFSPPEGWQNLVDELIKNLYEMNPDFKIVQVKEKFGGLRVYAEKCTEEQYELIHQTELNSHSICQECGSVNNVKMTKTGWIQSLCKKCMKRKAKEKAKEYLEDSLLEKQIASS